MRISRMRIFSSSNKKQKKRQKELARKDERIKKEQKKEKKKIRLDDVPAAPRPRTPFERLFLLACNTPSKKSN